MKRPSEVDQETITQEAIEKLFEIEKRSIPRSQKTTLIKTLANRTKNKLGLHDSVEVAFNTAKKYLTNFRNEVKALNLRHYRFFQRLEKLPHDDRIQKLISYSKEPGLDHYHAALTIYRQLREDKKLGERVEKIQFDHDLLKYLRLPEHELAQEAERRQVKHEIAVSNKKYVNYNEHINAIVSALKSESLAELTWGICAATGRREVEALLTGSFTKTQLDYSVTFSGSAKKRRNTDFSKFDIYSLVDSSLVLSAFKRLRSNETLRSFIETIADIDMLKQRAKINHRFARNLLDYNAKIMGEGFTFHDLRDIWGAAVVKVFLKNVKERSIELIMRDQYRHDLEKTQNSYKKINLDLDPKAGEYYSYNDAITDIEKNVKRKPENKALYEHIIKYFKEQAKNLDQEDPISCQKLTQLKLAKRQTTRDLFHEIRRFIPSKVDIIRAKKYKPVEYDFLKQSDFLPLNEQSSLPKKPNLTFSWLNGERMLNVHAKEKLLFSLPFNGNKTYDLAFQKYEKLKKN